MKSRINIINTSNKGKKAEFIALFAKHGYLIKDEAFKSSDLPEIISDPDTIAAMKSRTAAENHATTAVLIDDTSLDIEGRPDAGALIRKWLDEEPEKFKECIGKKATYRCTLAFTEDKKTAFLATGEVKGIICQAKYSEEGKGFGFDPVFQPDGSEKSLAQDKPDHYNARALAVENLLKNNLKAVAIPQEWKGEWQDIHSPTLFKAAREDEPEATNGLTLNK